MKTYKKMIHEVRATYVRNSGINSIYITRSQDVNGFIRDLFPVDLSHREAMLALYLNRANNTIGYVIISIGGVAGTICDPKLVFQHGLLCNASAIILIHNHPSGSLEVSKEDLELTRKIGLVGDLLSMPLLDHLILSPCGSFLSMADEGLL